MRRSFRTVLTGTGHRPTRGCLGAVGLAILLAGTGCPTALAEDLDPHLVGQLPGVFQAVAVSGQYAYLSARCREEDTWRGRLEIVNVSDPSDPRWISGCDTRLPAYDIAVSKHFAYLMTCSRSGDGRSELEIIDISDPANPQPVGALAMPAGNRRLGNVAVSGNYAYVAAGETGLQVIDVSNPGNPQPIAHLQTGGYAGSVALMGYYAYIADSETGFNVVDVRDPTAPRAVGRHALSGGMAKQVCVAGTRAYVIEYAREVDNTYVGTWGMQVLNITDPANPQLVSTYVTRGYWNPAVTVSGSFAYVCTASPEAGVHEFEIIDINNPTDPVRAGGYVGVTFFWVADVVMSGRYAFVVGGGGLKTLDIRPANPQRVGQYSFGDERLATRLAVSHGYAYVTDWEDVRDSEARLQILDLRAATNPAPVGLYATGAQLVEDLVVSDEYAYLALTSQGNSLTPNSFIVMDIRNPANPQRVGGYAPGSMWDYASLAVSDGYAYAVGWSEEFLVLNVGDATNPWKVGSFATGGPGGRLAISGEYAYLALADHGGASVKAIDVGNPARPERAGVYASSFWDPCWAVYAKSIAVAGGYAYVVFDQSFGSTRLEVIDVRNPADPSFVAGLDLGSWRTVESVMVKGHYLYIGGPNSGLQVFDVRDPAQPRRVGGNSSLPVCDLAADGDRLYVAAGTEGLVVLNLFRSPITVGTPRLSTEWSLHLTISGEPGSSARLQRSTNLRDWEDWVVLPLGEQPTEIGDPDAGSIPHRFYRAVDK